MILKLLRHCLLISVLLAAGTLYAEIVSKRVFQQDSDFKFDENILDLTVQTKKGSPYSEQVVDDDVKRLAAKGVFADVSASVRKLDDGTVEVTFRMLSKPVVSAVRFEGNQKIPDDKLRPELKFSLHTPLNEAQIMATADAIRKMYAAANRDATTVKPVFVKNSNGTMTVIFKIEEELRIRISDVNFEGNTVYSAQALRDAMETRYNPLSVSWLSWIPVEGKPGLYDANAIQRDRLRLRELYYRKGYLDFKIKDIRQKALEKDPEMIDLLITLEEGEPYFVGEIVLTGVSAFPPEKIRECIRQTRDNVFNVQIEEQDLNRIEAVYAPEGYADLDVRVIRKPNYTNHTVDLEYQVSEGPQYTIRDINISGNKWTKPYVILRELPFKPDDKVDRRKLDIAKRRLLGMNYFEDAGGKMSAAPDAASAVEVTAVNADEPGKKDININVNEKRFITGTIGAGWSDTDGLAGMVEIAHNNADVLDPANYFTGGGQKIRLYGLIGTERKDAVFEFTEPWLFGIPLRWDTSVYWREYDYDDWNESRVGFTTSLTKRFFDDFTSAQLGYTFEQVRIYKMSKKLGPIFQKQKGRELIGRIFLNLERDTRDSLTDPRSGYLVSAYGSLTTVGLGATQNYYKVELKGVNYFPFFHNWFVLMTGFKVGMMGGFGKTDFVPLYDRYFLGGGDSIRGFPYRSIGPVDGRKDNYGGEFMWLFTAELSHPIYKDFLRGAFFCDIGDTTKRNFKFEAPNMGIGYGLRIKLPNCPMPIHLDLAYPVVNNQKGVASKLRFHFKLGFAL